MKCGRYRSIVSFCLFGNMSFGSRGWKSRLRLQRSSLTSLRLFGMTRALAGRGWKSRLRFQRSSLTSLRSFGMTRALAGRGWKSRLRFQRSSLTSFGMTRSLAKGVYRRSKCYGNIIPFLAAVQEASHRSCV